MNLELRTQNSVISVLMSAYNNASTLEQAILSILNQSFRDFEFIIIDDHSTDASLKIIQKFAQKDARIKIISNEANLGLAKSLNLAIARASGKYMARQDAHATSRNDRLAKQIEFMETHADIDILGSASDAYIPPALSDSEIKKYLDKKNILIHGSIFAKMETIKSVQGYNPNYRYVQDYELWRRLAKKGAKFAVLAEPLYAFKQTLKPLRETIIRLTYLMNAKQGNNEILSIAKMPIIRKIEFARYIFRYLFKRVFLI